jgi:hypothetical protein
MPLTVKILEGWRDTKMTGTEWFARFLKMRKTHSLRKPEATSINRASSLTKLMLMLFFYKSERSVWSSAAWFGRHMDMDETGIKSVQISDRVIARRGCKCIGTLMSAEPGKLATSAPDVSAAGNTVPPWSVFPRVKFRAHFLSGAPAETQGDGSRPGWMKAE